MAKDLKLIKKRIKDRHPKNMIARYREYLLELASDCPRFWELLSEESLSDDRKIVSRTPKELFKSSPDLIKTKAYRIAPGWYLDINLDRKKGSMQKRVNIAERIYREYHSDKN